ncbi:MAG: prolipoprotein diacylglyceryl transferase [Desulfobaccales bacterium]
MRRILYEWRGIKLYAYPVMLYLGIFVGVIAGTYSATLHDLNPTQVYVAMLLLFPFALVGARLLFILSHWRFFLREPLRIWRRSDGGASLYGGLVLSFLVSLPLLRVMRLPLGAFWDAASVTMLTGMIFTKMGCLLNGCCAGQPTTGPLGMYLPDFRGIWCRRVPAQLLESGLAAMILLGLVGLWNRLPFDGALFLYTLATYSMGRWWLESAREDIDTVGPLKLHRIISVAVLAASITSFLLMWPRRL